MYREKTSLIDQRNYARLMSDDSDFNDASAISNRDCDQERLPWISQHRLADFAILFVTKDTAPLLRNHRRLITAVNGWYWKRRRAGSQKEREREREREWERERERESIKHIHRLIWWTQTSGRPVSCLYLISLTGTLLVWTRSLLDYDFYSDILFLCRL